MSDDSKQAYLEWILSLSDYLHVFCTLTYPKKAVYHLGYHFGARFRRRLNDKLYGRRYREDKDWLTSVTVVEQKHGRPHVHFMCESHPQLSEELIRELWCYVLDNKLPRKAIDFQVIRDKKAVARYITKNITWENPPVVSKPPRVEEELEVEKHISEGGDDVRESA